MAGHIVEDAPKIVEVTSLEALGDFVGEGEALKSLSISYRYDGVSGVSFVFPFFIVKNLEDPLAGGYIMQRVYLQDVNLRDIGWMLLVPAVAVVVLLFTRPVVAAITRGDGPSA